MLFTLLLLYLGIGAGIGIGALSVPRLGLMIECMAKRHGLAMAYARAVWLGGSIFAWPVGLYVLATGRLLLIDDAGDNDTVSDRVLSGNENASLVESGREPPHPEPSVLSSQQHYHQPANAFTPPFSS